MEITRRYRVNVGTSVKGVKTYDCTVEVSTDVLDEKEETLRVALLEQSDALVAELDKRYPPHIEEKK